MKTESISYYVIRDASTKHYYNGRDWEKDLQNVRARYERTIGAQKEVTRMESAGYDNCENLEIVPVMVVDLKPIKPKLRSTKKGFVIEISTFKPKSQWFKKHTEVSMWKGNKKKPAMLPTYTDRWGKVEPTRPDYDQVNHIANGRGVFSVQAASVFNTKEEAEAKLRELIDAAKIYIENQREDARRRGEIVDFGVKRGYQEPFPYKTTYKIVEV